MCMCVDIFICAFVFIATKHVRVCVHVCLQCVCLCLCLCVSVCACIHPCVIYVVMWNIIRKAIVL